VRRVKTFALAALLACSSVASADVAKMQPAPHKLGRDARVFVLDKDAPSADKTVPLARPRTAPTLKNKG
jgi:hypothetical protein